MRSRITILFLLSLVSISLSFAQMIENDGSVSYGNEWIDHNKDYYKIPVSQDGICRLDYESLVSAGIQNSEIRGSDIRLFEFGTEVPIFVSTDEQFGTDDYVLFYGRQNKGELDKYLYEIHEKQLNPEYSLFTDTLVYFLTFDSESINKRFQLIDNGLNNNLPDVENYYWHKEKLVNHSDHIKPVYGNTDIVTYSHLDIPEGFSSQMQKVNEYILEAKDYLNVGENPKLKFRMGTSTSSHIIEVSLDGKILEVININGYDVKDYELDIEPDDLNESMLLRFEGTDISTSQPDKNSQSIIILEYPRNFSFPGQDQISFILGPSLEDKYFEIPGLNMSQQNILLFDISNGYILYPEFDENNQTRFVIPASDKERELYIINQESAPQNVNITESIKFVDYSSFDEEYIILSNQALRTAFNGEDQLQAYANYRSSEAGGAYKSIIVDINQLYDQFGYGIQRHSQSVNNFSNFILNTWSNPKYIFIIGKGRDYKETRTDEQLKDNKNLFFVPTYGFKGSDVLLVAKKGENAPGIPVGRIAVKNPEQINEYLIKIKEHENYLKYGQSLGEKEWMKKVIHLSGGSPEIQDLLRYYLDEMGVVLSNSKFGGNIVTYGRTSSSDTESVTEKIIDDINDGASIISFFGHSGVSNSDFNIGELTNSKYPVFLSLGCYSGDIHTNVSGGQSEKFVLSENGVIAFIGSAGTAFIPPQYLLGKDFYAKLGDEMYGKSIGEFFKEVLETNKNSTYLNAKSLNQQMTLHGDPATKIHPHEGPDYICDFRSLQTIPQVINSNSDNFTLNFDIVNLGSWVEDSLGILIIRQYPDNTEDTISLKVAAPAYRTSVSYELPSGNSKGIGQNCIYIVIDPENKFEEEISPEAEENNELLNDIGEAGYCFYIINNGAKIIYPQEFSIVNTDTISLLVSTYNYFVNSQNFIFQLDTTDLFNSPLLLEHQEEFEGGLLEWDPPLNFEEGEVYYWRVSPDSLETGLGPVWSQASFIYLPESSEGWNQSHYYQFLKDEEAGIHVDQNRKFQFDTWPREVNTYSSLFDSDNPQKNFVDGSSWGVISPNNLRPSMNIFAFTPNVIFKSEKDYGQMNFEQPYSFPFNTSSEAGRSGVKDLLSDIPDSSIVFVQFILDDENSNLHIEEWDQDQNNLFDLFESYGATELSSLKSKGTLPYIFIFMKGRGKLQEIVGKNIQDKLTATQTIRIKYKDGGFKSTLIGPVKNWNKVLWEEKNKEGDDLSKINLQFYDLDLNPTIRIGDISEQYDIGIDTINSEENPYLQLEFEASDDPEKRTCPDIAFWRVLYESLPDALFLNDEFSYFLDDTLNRGENMLFNAIVFNNSSLSMDSLDVKFSIKKQDNSEWVQYKNFRVLGGYDTLHTRFSFPTIGNAGINEFTIELNPDKTPSELHYFNNLGLRRFFVKTDIENPILDVTFDGVRIKNGDIVSPRPVINMDLWDENTVLLLNDPEVFTHIELVDPNGESTLIPIDSDFLEFHPAEQGKENIAKMVFRPHLDFEGNYSLIVQAKDVSNNYAGNIEFMVDFQVVFEEQISNVFNFPNPFSSSTQFVFTLTGYELPSVFNIKIYSVSGILVKEISIDEIGPLRIGENTTKYSWDGRGDSGEKLPMGIYFYQVKAKNSSGEEFSIINNDMKDSNFYKDGWGKMAIIR